MEPIRLQKFLADQGIASRRKCEEFIESGRVKVNGKTVELGFKVDPEKDKVEFDGKIITNTKKDFTYILLNKPIGVVTTAGDQFDRETVLDLVKVKPRGVPVGRLDMYTSGALILTDDGDFVYKVTHPKHEINKTYTVTLVGIVSDEDIENLRKGVVIDGDYTTKPAKARIMKIDEAKNISRVEITIHEGKNRQVRKMCKAINHPVMRLKRVAMGNIKINDCQIGKYRYLTDEEIKYLKSL